MNKVPKIKLNNGVQIPSLGLGTWQGPPGHEKEVKDAVKIAIDIGYRHFDCAHVYDNEKDIGEALQEKIKEGVVKRDELFITSKLWNTFHRPDLVEGALKQSLKNLQLDYLDLYLIHWPVAFKEGDEFKPIDPATGKIALSKADYLDTWKAMEQVYKKGLTRAIGLSNFNEQQVERILKNSTVTPAVNQIECHPYLHQTKLREFCEAKGIKITAYCPLGSPSRPWAKPGDPDLINDPKIKEIAIRYGKTPGQILIKYNLDLGNIVIPKSANPERLKQNFDVFNFNLAAEDRAYIKSFECNGRVCPNDWSAHSPDYPFPDVKSA